MRPRYEILGLALGIVLVFAFLVPVIQFNTNISPACARGRLPCPLLIQTPITGQNVYWSITAYYFGEGTFLVTPSELGFIG